jgi:hypothetical protein
MPNNVKAMIVVLAIAATIFWLAKPIAILFSSERDFLRRRNVWFALTVTAFLSPSFWLFALVAVPLLIWAGRKDTNVVALYMLLLHVISPISVEIPVVGINRLFPLDMYRLLAFCVLLPAAWNIRQAQKKERDTRRLTGMDVLLLAFGAMHIILFVRPDIPDAAYLHDSITNVLRRALLFFVDIYLVYFVVSRSCSNRRAIVDVLAAFCLASAVMASVALFETLRHWLLYAEIGQGWGGELIGQYLDRGGVVRATVSSGHSLALGYLLAIATGFWLYLRTRVKSVWTRVGVMVLLWLGLLAAYSRGPWVGAVAIYFAYITFGPRAMPRLMRAFVISALLAGVILASPLGDRVAKVIPFLGGTEDAYNVSYRQRLAQRSIEMILENPWFGNQDAYTKLNDMRQGVGVIDFVNAYANVAVFYGLIGLFFFVGFILAGLSKSYRAAKVLRKSDPDLASLGVALVACILGTLLMISTSSFLFGYEKLFYVLAGLAAAYANLSALPARPQPHPSFKAGKQNPSTRVLNG